MSLIGVGGTRGYFFAEGSYDLWNAPFYVNTHRAWGRKSGLEKDVNNHHRHTHYLQLGFQVF